jgi:hypothetical protein
MKVTEEIIGYYYAPVMGGDPVEYGKKPYFGIRDMPEDIPLDNQKFVQILVNSIGSKAWINVHRYSLSSL